MVKVFQNLNWALSHFCSLVIQLVCEVSRHSNHILMSFPSPAPGETKIKRASCILMSTMNHLHHSDWIIYGMSDWTRLGFIASPSLVPHGPELQGKPAFYSNINICYTLPALVFLFTLVCQAAIEYSQLIKFLTHPACTGEALFIVPRISGITKK